MPDAVARFRALVRRRLEPIAVDPARAADIVEELAQHCSEHYTELIASGVPEQDAVEQVLAPLDDPRRVSQAIVAADRPRSVAPEPPAVRAGAAGDLWRDVRYAVRLLRRTSGFSAVAVLTLAIGIGANTAIFSIVHAVLLRPLPFAEPDRLVTVGEGDSQGRAGNVGFLTVADWRERTHAFEEIAAFRSWAPTLAVGGEPERIAGMRVSANFFRTLGVAPALGRDFTAADDTPAAWRVVLLSDGLWRRRFNADPAVAGRVITMNDEAYTIVGVMPASFAPLISEHFYVRADMWAALGYDATLSYACRSCEHLKAIARIKRGVSPDAAAANLKQVYAALKREHEDYESTSEAAATPLADELSGAIRPALWALAGAVGFVLLIACANVANLMLARVSARQRDLALRTALGAGRWRIVWQMIAESGVLAAAGGAAGLAFAAIAVPLIAQLAPIPIPRLAAARIDVVAVVVTIVLSGATAVLFGLAPAVRASRVDIRPMLHADGRQTASGPGSWARQLLVSADVAFALVLLTAAGLMIRSVGRLLDIDPGFDPRGVLTMQLSMSGKAYATDEAVVAYGERILDRVKALPGVVDAALAGQVPLSGNVDRWGLHIDGRPASSDDPFAERYSVTPGYFGVMQIPLRRGRLITDADRANTERVILVNDRAARALWPDGDALGHRVRIGGTDGPLYTIVGVVGDVHHVTLAAAPTFQIYTAQAQLTDSFLTLVIRSRGDPTMLAAEARDAVWSVVHDVPVYGVAPLATLVDNSVGSRRFVMVLLEAFGVVALLLTAIGIYGVVSYSVGERTREIGVRSALGASRRDIVRLVLGAGLRTIVAGVIAGIALAVLATRFLQQSLYGISSVDPLTYSAVAIVLFGSALMAQLLPVLRATRVDPAIALRQE